MPLQSGQHRNSIAKKPYIFVIFQGGGGPDLLPQPLDSRTNLQSQYITEAYFLILNDVAYKYLGDAYCIVLYIVVTL